MNPTVSIVLGSYNRRPYLRATLDNVRAHDIGAPYEIIVVDGGSTDGSLRYLSKQKDVVTIIQHNRGTWRGKPVERRSWGYFMNLAFRAAQGKYVCMISDDCLLVPGAIRNGVEFFEARLAEGRKVGSVAFYWRNWPSVDRYLVQLAYGTVFVNHGLYLRSALEDVGYIDEKTYRFYYADADLCLRMKEKGYECLACARSHVEHHSHANQAVRASNRMLVEADQTSLLTQWSKAYPDLKDYVDIHTMRYQDFRDECSTAERFRRIDRWVLSDRLGRWCHCIRGLLQIRTRFRGLKRLLTGKPPGTGTAK